MLLARGYGLVVFGKCIWLLMYVVSYKGVVFDDFAWRGNLNLLVVFGRCIWTDVAKRNISTGRR